jgi:DNA polymerase-3 subunit epsilon
MDFVTIDFETATSERSSPCEIGLTFVKDSKIIETKSWLIKPEGNVYDGFNIYIHGITPKDTKKSPEFDELWPEIKPLIDGRFLIAHFAGFDVSVLRKTLELYDIPFPTFNYICSCIFSRKVWTGLSSYGLDELCRVHNINLQHHHRAGNDSYATAELSLKAFDVIGASSIEEFAEKTNIRIGKVYINGYVPCIKKYDRYRHYAIPVGDPNKHNPDSIFYGKTVVFTGALISMERDQAYQKIVDAGGFIGTNVTRKTDYLIVGQQDYRIVGEDGMSGKQEYAVKLIEKGFPIEILSEHNFSKNIEV